MANRKNIDTFVKVDVNYIVDVLKESETKQLIKILENDSRPRNVCKNILADDRINRDEEAVNLVSLIFTGKEHVKDTVAKLLEKELPNKLPF